MSLNRNPSTELHLTITPNSSPNKEIKDDKNLNIALMHAIEALALLKEKEPDIKMAMTKLCLAYAIEHEKLESTSKEITRNILHYLLKIITDQKMFSHTIAVATIIIKGLETKNPQLKNIKACAHLFRAWTYLLADVSNLKKAEEDYSIVLSLDPSDPEINHYIHLSLLQEFLKNKKQDLENKNNNSKSKNNTDDSWHKINKELAFLALNYSAAKINAQELFRHREIDRNKIRLFLEEIVLIRSNLEKLLEKIKSINQENNYYKNESTFILNEISDLLIKIKFLHVEVKDKDATLCKNNEERQKIVEESHEEINQIRYELYKKNDTHSIFTCTYLLGNLYLTAYKHNPTESNASNTEIYFNHATALNKSTPALEFKSNLFKFLKVKHNKTLDFKKYESAVPDLLPSSLIHEQKTIGSDPFLNRNFSNDLMHTYIDGLEILLETINEAKILNNYQFVNRLFSSIQVYTEIFLNKYKANITTHHTRIILHQIDLFEKVKKDMVTEAMTSLNLDQREKKSSELTIKALEIIKRSPLEAKTAAAILCEAYDGITEIHENAAVTANQVIMLILEGILELIKKKDFDKAAQSTTAILEIVGPNVASSKKIEQMSIALFKIHIQIKLFLDAPISSIKDDYKIASVLGPEDQFLLGILTLKDIDNAIYCRTIDQEHDEDLEKKSTPEFAILSKKSIAFSKIKKELRFIAFKNKLLYHQISKLKNATISTENRTVFLNFKIELETIANEYSKIIDELETLLYTIIPSEIDRYTLWIKVAKDQYLNVIQKKDSISALEKQTIELLHLPSASTQTKNHVSSSESNIQTTQSDTKAANSLLDPSNITVYREGKSNKLVKITHIAEINPNIIITETLSQKSNLELKQSYNFYHFMEKLEATFDRKDSDISKTREIAKVLLAHVTSFIEKVVSSYKAKNDDADELAKTVKTLLIEYYANLLSIPACSIVADMTTIVINSLTKISSRSSIIKETLFESHKCRAWTFVLSPKQDRKSKEAAEEDYAKAKSYKTTEDPEDNPLIHLPCLEEFIQYMSKKPNKFTKAGPEISNKIISIKKQHITTLFKHYWLWSKYRYNDISHMDELNRLLIDSLNVIAQFTALNKSYSSCLTEFSLSLELQEHMVTMANEENIFLLSAKIIFAELLLKNITLDKSAALLTLEKSALSYYESLEKSLSNTEQGNRFYCFFKSTLPHTLAFSNIGSFYYNYSLGEIYRSIFKRNLTNLSKQISISYYNKANHEKGNTFLISLCLASFELLEVKTDQYDTFKTNNFAPLFKTLQSISDENKIIQMIDLKLGLYMLEHVYNTVTEIQEIVLKIANTAIQAKDYKYAFFLLRNLIESTEAIIITIKKFGYQVDNNSLIIRHIITAWKYRIAAYSELIKDKEYEAILRMTAQDEEVCEIGLKNFAKKAGVNLNKYININTEQNAKIEKKSDKLSNEIKTSRSSKMDKPNIDNKTEIFNKNSMIPDPVKATSDQASSSSSNSQTDLGSRNTPSFKKDLEDIYVKLKKKATKLVEDADKEKDRDTAIRMYQESFEIWKEALKISTKAQLKFDTDLQLEKMQTTYKIAQRYEADNKPMALRQIERGLQIAGDSKVDKIVAYRIELEGHKAKYQPRETQNTQPQISQTLPDAKKSPAKDPVKSQTITTAKPLKKETTKPVEKHKETDLTILAAKAEEEKRKLAAKIIALKKSKEEEKAKAEAIEAKKAKELEKAANVQANTERLKAKYAPKPKKIELNATPKNQQNEFVERKKVPHLISSSSLPKIQETTELQPPVTSQASSDNKPAIDKKTDDKDIHRDFLFEYISKEELIALFDFAQSISKTSGYQFHISGSLVFKLVMHLLNSDKKIAELINIHDIDTYLKPNTSAEAKCITYEALNTLLAHQNILNYPFLQKVKNVFYTHYNIKKTEKSSLNLDIDLSIQNTTYDQSLNLIPSTDQVMEFSNKEPEKNSNDLWIKLEEKKYIIIKYNKSFFENCANGIFGLDVLPNAEDNVKGYIDRITRAHKKIKNIMSLNKLAEIAISSDWQTYYLARKIAIGKDPDCSKEVAQVLKNQSTDHKVQIETLKTYLSAKMLQQYHPTEFKKGSVPVIRQKNESYESFAIRQQDAGKKILELCSKKGVDSLANKVATILLAFIKRKFPKTESELTSNIENSLNFARNCLLKDKNKLFAIDGNNDAVINSVVNQLWIADRSHISSEKFILKVPIVKKPSHATTQVSTKSSLDSKLQPSAPAQRKIGATQQYPMSSSRPFTQSSRHTHFKPASSSAINPLPAIQANPISGLSDTVNRELLRRVRHIQQSSVTLNFLSTDDVRLSKFHPNKGS